jgi:hypothetical protein
VGKFTQLADPVCLAYGLLFSFRLHSSATSRLSFKKNYVQARLVFADDNY